MEELVKLLETLPDVTIQRRGDHLSFLVGKKVFAFKRPEGVAVKLPKDKIAKLGDKVTPLVMGKRVMKEWIVLTNPGKKDLPLFKASLKFTSRP